MRAITNGLEVSLFWSTSDRLHLLLAHAGGGLLMPASTMDGAKRLAGDVFSTMLPVTPRQRADPAPEARTPFVEIRLAALLISPPKKRALPDYWQGPSTPPVKGVDKNHIPKGVSLQWVMDVAWKWRGLHVTPEERFTQCVLTKTGGDRRNLDGVMAVVGQETGSVEARPFRCLTEAQLQEMEKVAPQTAAIARREAQEIKDAESRSALTRTIARIQQLIVDQYGWPERD